MIRLYVSAVRGRGSPLPRAADFDEMGGTIGRGDGNVLVLPDPDRHISRIHAAVVLRAGRFAIVDRGAGLPTEVNGRSLGAGGEAFIVPGDRIRIGDYTLLVCAGGGAAMPRAPVVEPPEAPVGPVVTTDAGDGVPRTAVDVQAPFADLIGAWDLDGRGVPARLETRPIPVHAPMLSGTDGTARRAPPPLDLDVGMAPTTTPGDIDALFGLRDGPAPLPPARGPADPLAARRAGDHGHSQLDGVPRGHPHLARGVQEDAASPASSMPLASPARSLPTSPTLPPLPAATLPAAPLAPTDPAAPPRDMRLAGRDREPPVQASAVAAPGTSGVEGVAVAGTPQAESAPQRAAPDSLLAAFLQGAGVPELAMGPELTPALAAMLGQLLREATQGTLDLLVSRAIVRRELRASTTMVRPRDNNPLKFSPDVEAALAHLLTPQGRGFMSPRQALRDAHQDLRAHQFAVVAGLRDALAGVLARFDPQALEQRLAGKRLMDTLLPVNRRARLWDIFAEMYAEIACEAEDDFHALFGRELTRAYEAQLARIDVRGAGARRVAAAPDGASARASDTGGSAGLPEGGGPP